MSRRVNLIPAAGAGARFVEAGYATPKPLLPVDGEPMIVRAARALPEADLYI
ncbi:lipopolysaccharide biosynthesis protein, partial [bacterium]|nr:lipopolysaccharide biosynthesis protein [bacterium]